MDWISRSCAAASVSLESRRRYFARGTHSLENLRVRTVNSPHAPSRARRALLHVLEIVVRAQDRVVGSRSPLGNSRQLLSPPTPPFPIRLAQVDTVQVHSAARATPAVKGLIHGPIRPGLGIAVYPIRGMYGLDLSLLLLVLS